MAMPPRFLFDVGAGRTSERALAELGYDVVAVRDRDPSMPDDEILRWAHDEDRVVVTMDRDFGALVFQTNTTQAGVLLLRMQDATSIEKAEAVRAIVTHHGDAIRGHFAVYQRGRLRIRAAP